MSHNDSNLLKDFNSNKKTYAYVSYDLTPTHKISKNYKYLTLSAGNSK